MLREIQVDYKFTFIVLHVLEAAIHKYTMKYGESVFDILYLLFAIISGCLMMCKAADKTEKYMALATLILGCGDAFHLVPRVLNYFSDADYTAALLSFLCYIPVAVGAGLVPAFGMMMLPKTICYILMIAAFLRRWRERTILRRSICNELFRNTEKGL